MTRPFSIELREKIVNAYNKGLGSAKDIAQIFAVTPRTVFRYLKMQREKGDLSPEPIPGRPPILTDTNLAIIKKIVLGNTDGTLEQYRSKFYEATGIDVTIVTIFNACETLNLRRKKKASLRRSKSAKMSK